ncbi:MAG: thiamine-phosphate kinase [Gammaproteobacteria bacterium]|jgi:thiamine-monophosphate kinase|nr:thiamine-phosphate kinase [Gammaproteobacteria bacterium]|tara:strand:- start:660 stop:1613 length:954 start_codon:yes stop_codon:yes gene_type:complete
MADDEFTIIDRYFSAIGWQSDHVALGPGDDCAVLRVPDGFELCVSTDTLVSGVHFPKDCSGDMVARRSFAAAVSDLAAMGASPYSFTGALTLPGIDHGWLSKFSEELSRLSVDFEIPLVGGNLSRGPLTLTFTVMGLVPSGQALKRSGANVGEDVYVTGYPGDAGAGLLLLEEAEGRFPSLLDAYQSPQPRIEVGEQLRLIASAVIDVSDGLLADLRHLTDSSEVGAKVDVNRIPVSAEMLLFASPDEALSLALTAGDDYELCFSANTSSRGQIEKLAVSTSVLITRIGSIVKTPGIALSGEGAGALDIESTGYQHF